MITAGFRRAFEVRFNARGVPPNELRRAPLSTFWAPSSQPGCVPGAGLLLTVAARWLLSRLHIVIALPILNLSESDCAVYVRAVARFFDSEEHSYEFHPHTKLGKLLGWLLSVVIVTGAIGAWASGDLSRHPIAHRRFRDTRQLHRNRAPSRGPHPQVECARQTSS